MCLTHRHWYPHPKTWEYEHHQSRGYVPETYKTDSWFTTLVQNHQVQGSHWIIVSVIKVWHVDYPTHWCLLMLHYDPRAVAHYHRALWSQCPDQNGHWAYEGQHVWLRGIHTSDKNGNALRAQRISKYPSKFGSWCVVMIADTGKVPWPSSATARGLGGGVIIFFSFFFNQNELRIQHLYKEKGYAKYENTCMTSFKLSA